MSLNLSDARVHEPQKARGVAQALSHREGVRHKARAVDRNWRAMRSDWKAFDPRASLAENQARHSPSLKILEP